MSPVTKGRLFRNVALLVWKCLILIETSGKKGAKFWTKSRESLELRSHIKWDFWNLHPNLLMIPKKLFIKFFNWKFYSLRQSYTTMKKLNSTFKAMTSAIETISQSFPWVSMFDFVVFAYVCKNQVHLWVQ